uniref:MADS-box family protein n=1 Tax=Solanum tuberosum TaxID=4113 RepID=M1BQ16_SOLTU
MGRVRLSMKRVESNSKRQSTYCKRRCGILKKAQEISVLCDIDIILLLFSPTGKPTLLQGGTSNFDEIIAKFAQLTPQERAKSWWSNHDKINKVQDLALMECALRESLNAVHVRKVIFPKTGLVLVVLGDPSAATSFRKQPYY